MGHSPAAAQNDFERAVCEYRNCFAANQNNANACEGLRHIMDASAQAAGAITVQDSQQQITRLRGRHRLPLATFTAIRRASFAGGVFKLQQSQNF